MRFFWVFLLLLTGYSWSQTATPITFEPDQVRAMVAGKVPENSMQVFTLEGFKGQPASFYLMSAESNAEFELMSPENELVAKGKADKFGARAWKGLLPAEGTFTVVVFSSKGLADFQLTVEMP